jgi:hypothetical protein
MRDIQNADTTEPRRQQPTHPGAQHQGRPVGVMLIAGMFLLLAVLAAIGLFFMFSQPGGVGTTFAAEPFNAILFPLSLPFSIAIAVGLFQLREWGRSLACAFLVVAIIRFFVDAFQQYPIDAALALGFTNTLIPAAILLYLSHPSIRPAFRRNVPRL